MITYQQAERLAAAWVNITSVGTAELAPGAVITRPYGWVFGYQAKEPGHILVGNAPIIVDRINGEIIVTGTAGPLEEYLAEYEAALPPARLKLKPEYPPQAI